MKSGQLSGVLEAVPLPLLLVGADERIVFANARAVSIFAKELNDRHYIAVLRHPALLDAIEVALQSGEPRQAIYLGSEAQKETTYLVRAVPVPDASGLSVLVSFEDQTEMQEAGNMRRDFVANVSHELRTPLTALLGFIETIRGAAREDPAARDRFLTIMRQEAERMNRLVHDLLSLSRVESSERVRPTELVDAVALLRSAITSLQQAAEDSDVTIEVTVEGKPHPVPGDADQLTQVFSNLLENAIKYGSKPGTVSVRVSETDEEPALRGPALRVDVRDEGEGIEPLHIPRLTERFYRVDSHRSREMGGTGLGLAIVKHIVNRHRGRLRIASESGKGSVFSVILPRS
jgi:two-component system phosphate regulon sensor histidine kinase PhoR